MTDLSLKKIKLNQIMMQYHLNQAIFCLKNGDKIAKETIISLNDYVKDKSEIKKFIKDTKEAYYNNIPISYSDPNMNSYIDDMFQIYGYYSEASEHLSNIRELMEESKTLYKGKQKILYKTE